jgi:CBS domain-containing protein
MDFLNKQEPNTVRSIMTMFNRFVLDANAKRITRHQDLAEKMLDFGAYSKVMEFATGLVQDPSNLETFLDMFREETGDTREALVRDYMQPVPKGTVSNPKATLEDLIRFFKSASPDIRYFVVTDEGTQNLKGIVSVNDFNNHIDEIRIIDKTTPVVSLGFFNATPKVILSTDNMEYATGLFNEALKAGRKITKLLVVDTNKRPVGYLAEPDIVRWEAGHVLKLCLETVS